MFRLPAIARAPARNVSRSLTARGYKSGPEKVSDQMPVPDSHPSKGKESAKSVAEGSNQATGKDKASAPDPEAEVSEYLQKQNDDVKSEASGAAVKKTMAELDEEMRLKMEGISGEGGSSGVEYEGGKAEGLKRGVKANMFRVI